MPPKRKRAPRRRGTEYINNSSERLRTFLKRAEGSIKKLLELCLLTGCEAVCIIKFDNDVIDGERKVITFSSAFDGDWMGHWPDLMLDLLEPNTSIKAVGPKDYDKLWDKASGGNWANVAGTKWSSKAPAEEQKDAVARKRCSDIQESIRNTLTQTDEEFGVEMIWQEVRVDKSIIQNSGSFFQPLDPPAQQQQQEEEEEQEQGYTTYVPLVPLDTESLLGVIKARNHLNLRASALPADRRRHRDNRIRARIMHNLIRLNIYPV